MNMVKLIRGYMGRAFFSTFTLLTPTRKNAARDVRAAFCVRLVDQGGATRRAGYSTRASESLLRPTVRRHLPVGRLVDQGALFYGGIRAPCLPVVD